MNASSARILRGSASIQPIVDVLLGPAMIALALLFSLLLPVRAHAQTVGGAAADFAYQRSMSRIVAGTATGLQMSSPTTMSIINAGKVVGSFAVTEKRLLDLATLARYARASTVPGIIALAGTELLAYGLEKCADGTWCTREANKPNGSNVDWGSTGWMTVGGASCTSYSCSAEAACRAAPNIANGKYPLLKFIVLNGGTQAYCYSRNAADNPLTEGGWGVIRRQSSYVDPPGSLVPASDANIETAWKGAFQAKPFLQEKVWGFEDQTTQNQQWADALAQLASVAAPTSVAVTDPATSTTNSSGTTKVERTCTYTASANADAATQKDSPASVGSSCLVKTTNPDGTVKTETTTTDAAPKGGPTAPQKVDIDTCGLPGKPACKIDETGTPTDQKSDTATATSQAADNAMKQQTDALKNVLDGTKPETNWFNWLPVIPRSDCKPMSVDALGASVSVDWCPAVDFMKVLSTVAWAFTIMGGCIAEVKDALNGA